MCAGGGEPILIFESYARHIAEDLKRVDYNVDDLTTWEQTDMDVFKYASDEMKPMEKEVLGEIANYMLSDNYVAELTGEEIPPIGRKLSEVVTEYYTKNYVGEVTRDGLGKVNDKGR